MLTGRGKTRVSVLAALKNVLLSGMLAKDAHSKGAHDLFPTDLFTALRGASTLLGRGLGGFLRPLVPLSVRAIAQTRKHVQTKAKDFIKRVTVFSRSGGLLQRNAPAAARRPTGECEA